MVIGKLANYQSDLKTNNHKRKLSYALKKVFHIQKSC